MAIIVVSVARVAVLLIVAGGDWPQGEDLEEQKARLEAHWSAQVQAIEAQLQEAATLREQTEVQYSATLAEVCCWRY